MLFAEVRFPMLPKKATLSWSRIHWHVEQIRPSLTAEERLRSIMQFIGMYTQRGHNLSFCKASFGLQLRQAQKMSSTYRRGYASGHFFRLPCLAPKSAFEKAQIMTVLSIFNLESRSPTIIEDLLAHPKMNINAPCQTNGETPIETAAYARAETAVALLLKRGADGTKGPA